MINIASGNLIESDAEALVNTVNTVGVMGKGIALQFKRAFPEVYKAYAAACKDGKVTLGKMHVVDLGGLVRGPRYVINFPTKQHWRSKSRLEDIESGLRDLVATVERLEIQSIALPPLGCGYGGLKWDDVKPLIEAAFARSPDVDVQLFAPRGVPRADLMPNRTDRPTMSPGGAALVLTMNRYLSGLLDPVITLLEVHKSLYLLQNAGHELRLQYTKGTYGPYAANLRHLLSRLEGHYITGFGDASEQPDKLLELLPEAVREAERFVQAQSLNSLRDHLETVSSLIEGYEDPQGMELLASVHWVASQAGHPLTIEQITHQVHDWSTRKSRLLKPPAIEKAAHRLASRGWLEIVS